MRDLPETARERIAEHVDGILESVLYRIEQDKPSDFDALREAIDETGDDGTGAIHLDAHDWFALVAEVADELGWDKPDVSLDRLEQWLEEKASAAVIDLAQSGARERLDELESFMDEHGLALCELRSENRFGWAVHRAEREEDEAHVLEYRQVEGEIDVDVWEHSLGAHTIYFERYLARPEPASA